jgi:putative NADH-flavin reductase
MQITVFGATGNVGRRVVGEALSRGHEVTAVVRDPSRFAELPAAAIARAGDAVIIDDVVRLSDGQDVVINATRSATSNLCDVAVMTRTLLDGAARTGARLLLVGGAANLTIPGADGRTVIDDPKFLAPELRHIGLASLQQFDVCRAETQVDWAYLSPPAMLVPGERSGHYRLGSDVLLLDHEGNSRISIEDLAVVLLDEAENPRHHQSRFTAAY